MFAFRVPDQRPRSTWNPPDSSRIPRLYGEAFARSYRIHDASALPPANPNNLKSVRLYFCCCWAAMLPPKQAIDTLAKIDLYFIAFIFVSLFIIVQFLSDSVDSQRRLASIIIGGISLLFALVSVIVNPIIAKRICKNRNENQSRRMGQYRIFRTLWSFVATIEFLIVIGFSNQTIGLGVLRISLQVGSIISLFWYLYTNMPLTVAARAYLNAVEEDQALNHLREVIRMPPGFRNTQPQPEIQRERTLRRPNQAFDQMPQLPQNIQNNGEEQGGRRYVPPAQIDQRNPPAAAGPVIQGIPVLESVAVPPPIQIITADALKKEP